MPLPYLLLMAALAAVWLPPLNLKSGQRLQAWMLLAVLAVAAALWQGVMQARALPAPLLLAAAAWGLTRVQRLPLRIACWAMALLASLALALHAWPGFQNPKLFDAVRFTADARPFTQYLNFDKGLAGLLLLLARLLIAAALLPRLIALLVLLPLVVVLILVRHFFNSFCYAEGQCHRPIHVPERREEAALKDI